MQICLITLECVTIYLNDLLILTKDSFKVKNYIKKLKVVLTKLLQAGLWVITEKSSYCIDMIEYLGY